MANRFELRSLEGGSSDSMLDSRDRPPVAFIGESTPSLKARETENSLFTESPEKLQAGGWTNIAALQGFNAPQFLNGDRPSNVKNEAKSGGVGLAKFLSIFTALSVAAGALLWGGDMITHTLEGIGIGANSVAAIFAKLAVAVGFGWAAAAIGAAILITLAGIFYALGLIGKSTRHVRRHW